MRGAILCVALVAVSACASSGGGGAADPAFVVTDLSQSSSSLHWTAAKSGPPRVMTLAAVDAENGHASIDVGCVAKDNLALISFWIQDPMEGSLHERKLLLSFDGAAPTEPPLLARRDRSDDWSFDIANILPGFTALIADLKQHREVVAVVEQSGKEVLRYRFTLNGAAETIDYALKGCTKG